MVDFDHNEIVDEDVVWRGIQYFDIIRLAEELQLPSYSDPSNAPQEEANFIYVDGSGSDPAGIYYHDGSSYTKVSGGGGGGGASALSGLTIDTNKDWGGYNISNFGTLNGVLIESHSSRHENGGSDEMSVQGLSGKLADDQDPTAHSADHENNGSDEISVTGLSGDLADAQDPKAHATDHQNGGSDEISVDGLSGDLADAQDPKNHSGEHESGGADEMSVQGLSGDLSDPQDPKSHATDHHDGGSDEIDASDLAGAAGTNGQILQTDGAAVTWADESIGVDVENVDNTVLASDVTAIQAGDNLSFTDDGDNSATLDATIDSAADRVIASPNLHIPLSELANGSAISTLVQVPDGQTLTVYAWGATDDNKNNANITVELLNPDGSSNTSESTAWNTSTSGIASYSNSSGSLKGAELVINNNTGSDLTDPDGVSGRFGYVVE